MTTRTKRSVYLLRALRECAERDKAAGARRLGKPGTGHVAAVCDLKFVDGNMRLVSCDNIGQLRVWDVTRPTAAPLSVVRSAHVGSVNGLAVAGQCFASCGDDGFVRLWDAEVVAMPLRIFRGHSSYVTGVAFSGDGSGVVASVGLDSTVRLWDSRSPDAVFVFNLRGPAKSVAFAPGTASVILTAGNDGVFLWDVRKHEETAAAVVEETRIRTRTRTRAKAKATAPATPRSPAFSSAVLFFNSPMPAKRTRMMAMTAGGDDGGDDLVADADTPVGSFADGNTSMELRFDKTSRRYV
jgi:WD40 repeat protein